MKKLLPEWNAVFLIVSLVSVLTTGCAVNYPQTMAEMGAVKWSYESRIKPIADAAGRLPVTVSVQDIRSDAPVASSSAIGLFSLLPVLSFATLAAPSPHWVNVNDADFAQGGDAWSKGGIRRWEIADILARELQHSGIAKKAYLARDNADGDYLVQGSANFVHNRYPHYSGFGGIAYSMGILPVFTLPMWSEELMCDAHFEVVSRKTRTTVFSKDYHAQTNFFVGLLYSGDDRIWSAYGKEVFPQVVEQFVSDLKALPASAWSK